MVQPALPPAQEALRISAAWHTDVTTATPGLAAAYATPVPADTDCWPCPPNAARPRADFLDHDLVVGMLGALRPGEMDVYGTQSPTAH